MTTSARPLTLRPATAADGLFLRDLYGQTRAGELALTGWSAEQQRAFVEMQFAAQDADYRARFPQASFDVVVHDGTPVGRLYVDRRADAVHVLDILITSEHRGRGVGTMLMRSVLDEAATSDRDATLYVEPGSPAHAWYQRLGFVAPDEPQGLHLFMRWSHRPDVVKEPR